VLTRDGVLVARHENEISGTTDVVAHPEFAARRATKAIDGQTVSGWFTEDFTLAELRTLRARERLPDLRPANSRFDGLYTVPTFEEILRLIKAKEVETGRRIGVYPETKHPSYFAAIGLPHEGPLLALLHRYGYDGAADPVFIQSFEVGNLQVLRRRTSIRLVQLMDAEGAPADRPDLSYRAMAAPAGLAEIARYADAIGPGAALVFMPEGKATPLVANAHAAGLAVHMWTLRAENMFLPMSFRNGSDPAARGDFSKWVRAVADAGVDAVFTDFPGTTRGAFSSP
jgi:glycerophosphoryl diester phosphodiesterase